MISVKAVEKGKLISDELMYAGKLLTVEGNSPIQALLSTLYGVNGEVCPESMVANSGRINNVNAGYGDGIIQLARQIASVIGNVRHVAKNVINPKHRDIVDKLTKNENINEFKQIVQYDPHPLLNDPIFQDLIISFKGVAPTDIENLNEAIDIFNETFDKEDYIHLLKVGAPTMDNSVASYIKREDSIVALEELRFLNKGDELGKKSLSHLIIMFLMVIGVIDGRMDKGDALLSNRPFLNTFMGLRNNLGRLINIKIDILLKDVDRGALFVHKQICDDEFGINVYGPTYRKWIKEKGGSPEALLGLMTQYREGSTPDAGGTSRLLYNPTAYVKVYERYKKHRSNINYLSREKEVIRVVGEQTTYCINQDDTLTADEKITLHQRLHDTLQKPTMGSQYMELYIRRCLCDVYAPDSMVFKLLCEMDGFMDNDGENTQDPERALLLTSIKLISEWLTTGVTLHERQ